MTKVLKIGSTLLTLEKEKMVSFLRANQDVFAWKHKHMSGIDKRIIQHHFNVNSECKPVQQKQRIFTPECNKAITKEVKKLLEPDFINILLEGEISNCPWSRRNQKRSSSSKRVLPSCLSIWGEPHIGDQ